MLIDKLFEGIKWSCNQKLLPQTNIVSICHNTNDVTKGSLFFCLKGTNTDGHNFIAQAFEKGATACVVEHIDHNIKCLQIQVSSTRAALAKVCANFFGNPADSLFLIGVTGTNGKTSTCHIAKHMFESAGHICCAIGTLGYWIGNQHFECNLTTPDPFVLQSIFDQCNKAGVKYVFMEVSAHAIYFEKIYGLKFLYGVLTNITQDHLEFFKTFEAYKQTKLGFLKSGVCNMLVVNSDDESIEQFNKEQLVTYGLTNPADTFAVDLSLQIGQSEYTLNVLDNVFLVKTKLSGLFNVYNVLAAATVAILEGIDSATIAKALATMPDINGRYNVFLTKNGKIILDFAHTPDGLENILKSVQQATFASIICVFGCNGNRDHTKRPIMGAIAEKYCQKIILTSDNPRFENPHLIAKDILDGVEDKSKFVFQPNRQLAIFDAISMLNQDNIVVICGKGGEKYQDINGVNVPHSDKEQIEKVIEQLNIKLDL